MKSIQMARLENKTSPGQMTLYSPSFTYALSTAGACNKGVSLAGALSVAGEMGALPLKLYPYDPNSCQMPSAAQLQVAAGYKTEDYARVSGYPISDKDFEDIRKLVGADFPVVIAITVPKSFESFFFRGPNDVLKANDASSANPKLGHALVVVGYDDKTQAVLVLNSWGNFWGNNGLGWIDYGYFREIIRESYVALEK